MILKFILVSCLALVGCVDDTPVFIDCGNGYQVRPPLSCPEVGAKF
jgi:hypothetical protein